MFPRICLLALLCAAPAVSKTAYHRDWTVHPAIVERTAPESLFALGDIHGDYDRLVKLLAAAKIIDDSPAAHWAAGKAVLVVTGDMVDKGPKPVEVLHILMRLQSEAPKSGGEVILLSGNHEAEFLAGPDAKKAADFISDLKKNSYSAGQVAACETELGEFLCGLPYGARVGDWFFSHGGNTAGRTIPQIEADIMRGVDKDGFGTKALTAPDSLLEARLGEGKDQWVGLHNEANLLQNYSKALGVKHLVQGHQHNEIRFSDGTVRHTDQLFGYKGLLYLIDCGMSEGVDDSHGAILHITAQQIEAIYPDAPFVRPL
jgi:hypothetical protein